MHDYLSEKYEREQGEQRFYLVHWIIVFGVVVLVALILAATVGRAARNAAIDRIDFDSCYTRGC